MTDLSVRVDLVGNERRATTRGHEPRLASRRRHGGILEELRLLLWAFKRAYL